MTVNEAAVVCEVTGVIRDVDRIGREITVVVDGRPVVFDVPADCAIFLHGERVKLRLLQPQDHACLLYTPADDRRVTRSVRIDWVRQPSVRAVNS